jgi:PAS domain S-box-containing protein
LSVLAEGAVRSEAHEPRPDNSEPLVVATGTDAAWAAARLPVPALLEDGQGRIADANDALCALLETPREALIGRIATSLIAEADRPFQLLEHARGRQLALQGQALAPRECRLLAAAAAERWCRLWLQVAEGAGPDGAARLQWLMQDTTAEHRLRAQADRLQEELTQWFEISPSGEVVFDDAGLILRSNAVFETWVGGAPVTLADAPEVLQRLLGWVDGELRADLRPGLPWVETVAELDGPQAPARRLRARLRAFEADDGSCRVMAHLVDQSAAAGRDIAELERWAMSRAAGAAVVSLQVLVQDPATGAQQDLGTGALETPGWPEFGEHMLEAGSQPTFERLRQARLQAQLAEGRYAVRHPELGRRWLHTHVEPTRLPGGRAVTVAVTLDVTEEERSRRQREELLRELTTILDGSPVGIAYLREGRLVRCNLRFERMLGFVPGAAAGVAVQSLFDLRGPESPGVEAALQALSTSRPCDIELTLPALPGDGTPGGDVSWYALSLRRAESAHDGAEAVAVLTNISRLKHQQAQVERALHERELMFNQSDVGIAWLRGGEIVRANAAMSELTGLSPRDLAGRSIATLLAAGDALLGDREMQAMLAAQGRHASEQRLRQRDGTLRWTQVSVRAVEPADPRSDLICSFVDVDERQRARESLQQLAGRTRAVLDSVLVGIVTLGTQGIEWMNRSARRMFGGELEDFVGAPLGCVATAEAGHPLSRTDWLARLADGESEIFECQLKARDGREFWVVGNAVATPRDSAVGRQVTFAFLDIEARRQAEVRISSARASLQRLIETAPLAIALFDAEDLAVVECNQGAQAFFGHPTTSLLGGRPEDCLEDEDQAAALRASLVLARDTAEGVRREITRAGRDGEGSQLWDARFVQLGVSQTGAAGRGQVLLVANDVTELRVAEQARLDAAIAQREMLVREVHHRIKNNLQGVAGLLQQNAQRQPEISAALLEAIGQVQAIAQVYGLQVGANGPLDLVGMLRAIATTVQRSLNHVIDVSLGAEQAAHWMLPETESIPLALSLNELLINAVKHGDASAVRCRVHARANEVAIEIRNGGSLPAPLHLRGLPQGMYGLGLVRSLLPRREATLELHEREGIVITELTLRPPSVMRQAAADA